MANNSAIEGFGTVSKSLLASITMGWTKGACITLERGLTFCRKVCHNMNACIGGGWKSRRLTTSRTVEKSSVVGSRNWVNSAEAEASSSLEDLLAMGSWNWRGEARVNKFHRHKEGDRVWRPTSSFNPVHKLLLECQYIPQSRLENRGEGRTGRMPGLVAEVVNLPGRFCCLNPLREPKRCPGTLPKSPARWNCHYGNALSFDVYKAALNPGYS